MWKYLSGVSGERARPSTVCDGFKSCPFKCLRNLNIPSFILVMPLSIVWEALTYLHSYWSCRFQMFVKPEQTFIHIGRAVFKCLRNLNKPSFLVVMPFSIVWETWTGLQSYWSCLFQLFYKPEHTFILISHAIFKCLWNLNRPSFMLVAPFSSVGVF